MDVDLNQAKHREAGAARQAGRECEEGEQTQVWQQAQQHVRHPRGRPERLRRRLARLIAQRAQPQQQRVGLTELRGREAE